MIKDIKKVSLVECLSEGDTGIEKSELKKFYEDKNLEATSLDGEVYYVYSKQLGYGYYFRKEQLIFEEEGEENTMIKGKDFWRIFKEGFNGKEVSVVVRSEKEAIDFINKAHSEGLLWGNENSVPEDMYWSERKTDKLAYNYSTWDSLIFSNDDLEDKKKYKVDYSNIDFSDNLEEVEVISEVREDVLLWAKDYDDVIIPSKREEDSDYDIYARFEEDYIIINPQETKMIPTGLRCAMNKKWRLKLEERGSTGTKAIIQQAGVIDSGYRGEIKVPITNGGNKPIIILKGEAPQIVKDLAIVYPYTKAICQAKLDEVPSVKSVEIPVKQLKSIPSERKEGMTGSSGK